MSQNVALFGDGSSQALLVKMTSCWRRVGLISLGRRHLDTEINTQEKASEGEGEVRNWGDAFTCHRMPRISSKPPEARR